MWEMNPSIYLQSTSNLNSKTHTDAIYFLADDDDDDLLPLELPPPPPAAAAPGLTCGAAASCSVFLVSALVLATCCFTTSVSAVVLPVCAAFSSTSASPSLALFCASSSLVSVPLWSASLRRLTAPAISTAVAAERVQRRGQRRLDVDDARLEERLQLGRGAQRRREQRELVALLGVVVDRVVRGREHLVDRDARWTGSFRSRAAAGSWSCSKTCPRR